MIENLPIGKTWMTYARMKEAIPQPVRRHLGPLRQLIFRPGFALSRMPMLGELISAIAPTLQPPILVVSLPRCGSSWVGSILGSSETALYLREPITQSYVSQIGKGTAPVFELGACKDLRLYDRLATRAFNGVPRFGGKIVHSPGQWTLLNRKCKRVVIKEVNPLAVEHWWEAFHPKVIFLVRHPVAVMRSHDALGWKRSGWEQGGAHQAEVQNLTMKFLQRIDHAVVRYEDLCAEPLREFARIFGYCGLPLSAAVRSEIEGSSNTEAEYVPGRYDTVRDSRRMRERWRFEVDPKDVELVRRGYLAMQPSFYTDASDW
jgi:hypothetical protein